MINENFCYNPNVYFCRMNLQFTGMRSSIIFLYLILSAFFCSAQYYYNDIISTEANRKNFSILQKEKIKKVAVKAYDSGDEIIDDFVLYQEIDAGKRTLTTFSKTNLTDASILETRYNPKGFPESSLDSSEGASTRTSYLYDEKDLLISMQSISIQSEQKENVVTEKRRYSYNAQGMPEKMVRTKGEKDSMTVIFIPAENGFPGEEQWFKSGQKVETWFYYYDAQNRLTDIVRFNEAARQMLPDYLFSYDDRGNLANKITVSPGTSNFRIWQYKYSIEGLKIQETVLNRDRKPEGKLVYEYQ